MSQDTSVYKLRREYFRLEWKPATSIIWVWICQGECALSQELSCIFGLPGRFHFWIQLSTLSIGDLSKSKCKIITWYMVLQIIFS
jgi:hypothetical protein